MALNRGVDAAARLIALHRYTITSEGASPGYFRLVEDPEGAWVQWPEVASLIADLPDIGSVKELPR